MTKFCLLKSNGFFSCCEIRTGNKELVFVPRYLLGPTICQIRCSLASFGAYVAYSHTAPRLHPPNCLEFDKSGNRLKIFSWLWTALVGRLLQLLRNSYGGQRVNLCSPLLIRINHFPPLGNFAPTLPLQVTALFTFCADKK